MDDLVLLRELIRTPGPNCFTPQHQPRIHTPRNGRHLRACHYPGCAAVKPHSYRAFPFSSRGEVD